jgi:hypothetical protein
MAVQKLPPLILHPFCDRSGPEKLTEASRASLILNGMLPAKEATVRELEETLIDGRYCEISMLFYLGKDLQRWISQCAESVERNGSSSGIRPESFAALLIEQAPPQVGKKLQDWGVQQYESIFARALGLHAIFTALPERFCLSPDFLRYYYRFADDMYSCRQKLFQFTRLNAAEYEFQVYASGEYTRMLEQEWEQ